MVSEKKEIALKRLKIRSWRRGTKEMDLILGSFVDSSLSSLGEKELAVIEALIDEEDEDIYSWIMERTNSPKEYSSILNVMRSQEYYFG